MTQMIARAVYGGTFETESGTMLALVLTGEVVDDSTEPLTILQPSSQRVSPGCIHFGTCGGCQYQHAAYPEQLLLKRHILAGLLTDASSAPLSEATLHAAEPWGYRNRIRLRVAVTEEGPALGYSRRASNAFLPIVMCPIATPLLWRAAQAVLALAGHEDFSSRWLGDASELELFCTPDEKRLQLQIFLREASPARHSAAAFASFCQALQAMIPELEGGAATLHPDAPRRARLGWAGVSWGASGLLYPAAEREYWVSRGAFFQINRFLVDRLVRLVTGERQGKLAWDLYAGVGLFTRALADSFQQVIAVEGSPRAAEDLGHLARAQPSIVARQQSTLDFLRSALHQREQPDLVVLDPPRAGLGPGGANLLARTGAPEIVYVSCDPTTLALDLRVLLAAGYKVKQIDLIDLFPQTFHIETVVHLRRTAPAPA